MGMFDKPQYLTGREGGYVEAGDVFWLHNARVDGTVVINGTPRDQVKLLVSHTEDGEQTVVWASGVGIVNQVKRMSPQDRAALPMEVRLDAINTGKGNPAHVMSPADAPARTDSAGADDDPAVF